MGFRLLLLVAASLAVVSSSSAQNLTCGIKPIPEIGCRIGRCVDGMWEQVCD